MDVREITYLGVRAKRWNGRAFVLVCMCHSYFVVVLNRLVVNENNDYFYLTIINYPRATNVILCGCIRQYSIYIGILTILSYAIKQYVPAYIGA